MRFMLEVYRSDLLFDKSSEYSLHDFVDQTE